MKRNGIFILSIVMALLAGCGASPQTDSPVTVDDYDLTVPMVEDGETLDIDGKYTGEIVNGLPQGEGIFVVDGESGNKYVYEGTFADGCYNGFGVTTITNENGTIELAGTYTNGEYTPSTGEAFNYIGQLDLFGKFAISEDVIEFIDSNTTLFPIATHEAVQATDLQEFSNRQFNKTRKQDTIGLVKLNLYAAQVFEDDFIYNGKLTYLLAVDDDGNYYAVYYLGSAEVYDEDTITVYAIPCATSGFDNISGGITNVTVMSACYIEKN